MSTYTKIAVPGDLPAAGEAKEFPCGDKVICIVNVNGTFSALDNLCLHRGGPVGQGSVDGGKVACPWHGWQWDPVTGEAGHNPAAKLAVYRLKIEGGDVLVEI
jgi:nitrite reductase (NADH) small subunit